MRVPLHLVSCVSLKLDVPAKAEDLYVSPWFRKARAYVKSINAPWRILSARYGLLSPSITVGPYEVTLNAMAAAQRRTWAYRVSEELEQLVDAGENVVMLAGARYREFPGSHSRVPECTRGRPARGTGDRPTTTLVRDTIGARVADCR